MINPLLFTQDEEYNSLPDAAFWNMIAEVDKATGQAVLIDLPGTEADLIANATGELFGMYARDGLFNGELFYVDQDGLKRQGLNTAAAPALIHANAAPAFAGETVQFANIRGFLCYIDSTGDDAFVYDGATTIQVAGLPDVQDVAAMSHRFIWIDAVTDQVYYSDLNAGTFTATNFFTAEVISDRLQSVYTHGGNLYLGGTEIIEIYRPSTNYLQPFSYTGTFIPIGALGPAAWADSGKFCAFVGVGEDGYGVYQLSGASVQMISSEAINRTIERFVGDNVNLRKRVQLSAYNLWGHTILELTIPEGEYVYYYDAGTGAWARFVDPTVEQLGLNRAGYGPRHHVTWQGRHWIGRRDALDMQPTKQIHNDNTETWPQYFGRNLERRWSYWLGTPARAKIDKITQQITYMLYRNTPVMAENPFDADRGELMVPGANDAQHVAGETDMLDMFHSGRQRSASGDASFRTATVHLDPRHGHKAEFRRCGEVRQPGRLVTMRSKANAYHQVGPIFVNSQTL